MIKLWFLLALKKQAKEPAFTPVPAYQLIHVYGSNGHLWRKLARPAEADSARWSGDYTQQAATLSQAISASLTTAVAALPMLNRKPRMALQGR